MGHHDGNCKTSEKTTARRQSVIESLIAGSVSSTITTILYQPLELLKTKIQIDNVAKNQQSLRIGRAAQSTISIAKYEGIRNLWRGTGASLLRSGPGVGFYYATLNIMQTNLSSQNSRPDSSAQAFCFGLTARSVVSFILLPVTVVKVRYESGKFAYPSLAQALKIAYLKNGWVGIAPTILRDSLFSGIYYMCYTKLKYAVEDNETLGCNNSKLSNSKRFIYGIGSGLAASIITNPIDVIKTNIQIIDDKSRISMRQIALVLLKDRGGVRRFADGIVLRALRRTLVAATTWSIYDLINDRMGC